MPASIHAAPLPLAGVRVLDLSRVLAGPWAGQILADLGAEVIKIERPGTGDDTRGFAPPVMPGTQESAYFVGVNRNKRSVTLDIATPEGQEIALALIAQSDILVENFKVGGLAKYGLDYASLKEANPRLIYCSITGFGQDGPYAKRAGYDFMIQGLGGLMSLTGRSDAEEGAGPVKVGVALTDILTGLYATVGVLAALAHRERSGEGQHIDTALLDVQVACLATLIALVLGTLASAALYRRSFFGKESISLMLILPIALPGIITGIELMKQRIIEGRADSVLRFADAALSSARSAAVNASTSSSVVSKPHTQRTSRRAASQS